MGTNFCDYNANFYKKLRLGCLVCGMILFRMSVEATLSGGVLRVYYSY